LAAYAKQEVAARDAARKERSAQKLAQYNAELKAYKRAQAQANADRDFAEKKRHNEETEKNYRAREQRLAAQGGSGGGTSASNTPMPITFPNGRVKTFSKADNGDNWVNVAYEEAVAAGMPRLMRVGAYEEEYEVTSAEARKAWMETWSVENARGNSWDGWKDGNATEDIDEDLE
jgi:hypothetical protein